ncbi:uncharacterized protein LOC134186898 isoform X2 [Corticium candelabrum]|nr:uncharacterized protein LOC134186898 isoform X2 [Corticium candelabrum]
MDMEWFKKLNSLVLKEQEEFLAFLESVSAQQSPQYRTIPEDVTAAFKSIVQCQRMQIEKLYPRYYQLHSSVSLDDLAILDQTMIFVKTALKQGDVLQLSLPKASSVIEVQQLVPDFDLVISQDATADRLSKEHNVDIVVATESLSTLASNQSPDFSHTWQIPIAVKLQSNNQKCIFIDNPIILNTLAGRERSRVVFDRLLRQITMETDMHDSVGRADVELKQKSQVHLETDRHQRAAETELSSDSDSEFVGFDLKTDLTVEEMRVLSSDEADTELQIVTDEDFDCECSGEENSKSVNVNTSAIDHSLITLEDPHNDQCFVYNLWKCGEMTILVRSRGDGLLEDKRMKGKTRRLFLVPKLEFQVEYGYERITHAECAHWWMGLYFRPRSHVAIVYLNGFSFEVLQCKIVDLENLGEMVRKDCSFSPKQAMKTLLHILIEVHKLSVGQYLISHTAGASDITILESETTDCNSADDTFDLWRSAFGELDREHESDLAALSCLQVSVNIQSPHQKKHNLIPGTFPPE